MIFKHQIFTISALESLKLRSQMHEYSIISDLVLLAEDNARTHNATKIHKITIDVGERSAVEVDLLQSAFEVFKEESAFCRDSVLVVRRIAVELLCKDCGEKFNAKGMEYGICKYCNGANLEIIKGRELNLARLEME